MKNDCPKQVIDINQGAIECYRAASGIHVPQVPANHTDTVQKSTKNQNSLPTNLCFSTSSSHTNPSTTPIFFVRISRPEPH
jgi:hypothetical protein